MAPARSASVRLVALVAGSAAIIAGLAVLALSWPAPAGSFMPRVIDSASIVLCLLVLGIALLIAWRAGDRAANLAVALSLSFICGSIVAAALSDRLHAIPSVRQSTQAVLFFFAAAFYIRSSQLFPKELTAADIGSSPTIWGQSPPLRQALTYLLRPAAAWIISAVATGVILLGTDRHVFVPMWMAVTALGIVFFYVTLRGPDVEARQKVLWFFEAALAAAIATIFAGALDLALPRSVTSDARAVIQLILDVASGITIVICVAAAVLYAGAISPALIVRKTLVYSATVAFLVFLFAVIEIYVAHSVIHALHVSDRFASAVLGAIFGLAFHPLKHRIEQLLKRYAPKTAAVAAEALASRGI